MTELREITKQELLQELKNRVINQRISEEEIFLALESPDQPEIITKYKKAGCSKLTKEDWKKACKTLEKDKVYQEEVNLWDNIEDE